MLPLKSFACELKSISVFALPAVNVTVLAEAACTIAPVSVNAPPVAMDKLPLPMLDAPNTVAT